ncbi:MAG: DbpA RNA binding domain-containing protein [Treponema sp.]|nr:DbpA RNA binding domain-containing protein [Treponema sp.]
MSLNHDAEIDFEQVKIFLKEALNKVMTQENPDLLNDLKKTFKQTIPLSKRMYVAAYLVKEAQTRRYGQFNRTAARSNKMSYSAAHNGFSQHERASRDMHQKDAHTENTFDEPHAESHTRVQIDESLAATIFISIGRNRRVYPRDLVGILVNVAGLERDRIGDIRVLANYSFVQLFKDDAEKAIAALNNYDYRGRKLAVSYSRQKSDDETALPDAYENRFVNQHETSEDAKAYAAAEKAAADKEPFASPNHVTGQGQNGDFLV